MHMHNRQITDTSDDVDQERGGFFDSLVRGLWVKESEFQKIQPQWMVHGIALIPPAQAINWIYL